MQIVKPKSPITINELNKKIGVTSDLSNRYKLITDTDKNANNEYIQNCFAFYCAVMGVIECDESPKVMFEKSLSILENDYSFVEIFKSDIGSGDTNSIDLISDIKHKVSNSLTTVSKSDISTIVYSILLGYKSLKYSEFIKIASEVISAKKLKGKPAELKRKLDTDSCVSLPVQSKQKEPVLKRKSNSISESKKSETNNDTKKKTSDM